MNELVRVVDMLKTARKIAEEAKADDILIYLISMAMVEAEHQIRSGRKNGSRS